MNILEKRGDLPFSRKSDRKKEKSTVSFTHEQNIICSQTLLDGIAHEQTIICRQLLVGHVVGSRPMKRKKNLLQMIKLVVVVTTSAYSTSIVNILTFQSLIFFALSFYIGSNLGKKYGWYVLITSILMQQSS